MILTDGYLEGNNWAALVKKGHAICGDSVLISEKDWGWVFGVFDGASGEKNAAEASRLAAKLVDKYTSVFRDSFQDVFEEISHRIEGYTTASVVLLKRNGEFHCHSVGDSPIYLFDTKWKFLCGAHSVGKGDSIFKFFSHRHYLRDALGGDFDIFSYAGQLSKGNYLLLCSDGVSDNFFVTVQEGYVEDPHGLKDLTELADLSNEKALLKSVVFAVEERMFKERMEKKEMLLIPKPDDISIVTLQFK